MLSNLLASIAIVISILALGISLHAHVRDNYKLKCSGYLLQTTSNLGEFSQICVDISNVGRRPIEITSIYYETDPAIAAKENLPPIRTPIFGGLPNELKTMELKENQTRQFISKDLKKTQLLKLAKEIEICIKDSRGKTHKIEITNDVRDT